MKNKKAFEFLSYRVIGLLMSALVIIVLVGYGVKIYFSTAGDSDMQKAEKVLSQINDKINYVHSSNVIQNQVNVFPPKNWILQTFVGASTPAGECLDKKYCLCICNSNCNRARNCKSLDFNVEVSAVNPSNAIVFEKAIEVINIIKSGDKIILTKS